MNLKGACLLLSVLLLFSSGTFGSDQNLGTAINEIPLSARGNVATTTPPVPILVMPGEGDTTTCEDQEIHIDLTSGSDIDPSSILFCINADTFVVSDAELDLVLDTLIFRPSGLYTYETGPISVCLGPVFDTSGDSSDIIFWEFFVDLEPPTMSNESPTSPPVVTGTGFDISVDIADVILPVDSSTIIVQVINNNGADTSEVVYSDFFATWDGTTFSFPSASCGASFNDGETVTVRLMVRDLPPATSDCPGNLLDTAFVFVLSETPCKRVPNPITPGVSAGKNDEVVFEFPNMRKGNIDVHIYIYDLRNNEVADIVQPNAMGQWIWDGTDTGGELLGQGTYVYLIVVDDETECSGTISIAR